MLSEAAAVRCSFFSLACSRLVVLAPGALSGVRRRGPARQRGAVPVAAARRRRALATAKKRIAPLTNDLRSLVRPFSEPINGSVDFGLLECLLRVCKWPHFWLVDLLIYGFQPVGEVPVSGCHRPVDEPSTESFSRASNLRAFDDAVERLERKARKAQSDVQSLRDQVEVWDTTMRPSVENPAT